MKKKITQYDFIEAFEKIRPDNFSYDGLIILFNYFEELESDIGEQIEFDVIAICCNYSEASAEDIINDYKIDLSDYENEEDKKNAVEEYLNDQGIFIGCTGESFVYQVM